ncbi:bifunctional glutamate N-acetyltransferase/amino-acid acetyltransferase ArgJ [Oceanobacillus alkalisoli]|uniref:bifunctional glutamate N-acetyltransferase/amino-acid acetyltransferase ArgJ n=1 Tax=Oceanobacillus alkalisoli TaxID=2925113 RepID=UPI001EE3AC9F|nr:bifunctional glutamate N-acetyltransferase/amino-acid acetyltransferase ArgJ [Oceanobacillus alkalisoli]MCG5102058.1 bifunctional glutamate N-acetyltransferase/amino-acid acetyltransferase ArgJ [Oceanobacillus alkalisoli]
MTLVKEKQLKILEKGKVTTPKGFQAGGVHTGLRKTKLDFGWIHSEVPATAAGVYTLNAFKAAPLQVTKNSLDKTGKIQTLVVNSANANAVTGPQGEKNALETQKLVAEKKGVEVDHVAVASTGIIGVQLPMEKLYKGIHWMDEAENQGAERFESAILTTDTVTKYAAVEVEIDGKPVTISGAAKGSGMIAPNMATMLSFITTDAAVEQSSLEAGLRQVTDKSFNMITVDGDCSTNDMVLVLANGLQENQTLNESHPDWDVFLNGLQYVSQDLAKQIAKDGEGATKLIEVQVKGAGTDKAAGEVAKAIISSNLVKAAVYGSDPNWGRIVCAVGYSEQPIAVDKVSIALGDLQVVDNGLPIDFDEEAGTEYLQQETVTIHVDLQNGTGEATAWGCDLTYDYVKINASYRT